MIDDTSDEARLEVVMAAAEVETIIFQVKTLLTIVVMMMIMNMMIEIKNDKNHRKTKNFEGQ